MDDEKAIEQIEKGGGFCVGDIAVYPVHGIGLIKAIENRVINGERQNFYIMNVLGNSMTIMIPVSNAKSVGLRDVINKKEIPKVYEAITIKKERKQFINNQTWNRRYREYMDKIKAGSLCDVAEVFRDLYLLKFTKDLSFGERKLLDTATTLLLSELSTARNTDEKTIMSEIESLLDDL